MISLSTTRRATVVFALACAAAVPAVAQPAATYKSASEFYLAYRAAFDKATSIDELLPWVAKERRDVISKAPAAERKEGFDMMKMFDDRRSVKVVKETLTAAGAELQVEGVSAESQTKATGVVTLLKEDGAWRIVRESWKGGGLR